MTKQDMGIGLADAIKTVRTELEQAIQDGQGSDLAFKAGPLELEFEVAFTGSGSVEGGVKAWVVTLGARGEMSNTRTHRLTLSLTPVNRLTKTEQLIDDVGSE